MKLTRRCISVILIVSLLALIMPNTAWAKGEIENVSTDRILIKYKDELDNSTKMRINAKYEGKSVEEISPLGVHIVKVPPGKVKEKIKAIKKDRNVVFAEPDNMYKAFFVPNDIFFNKQWALPKIKAPNAWDIIKSNSGVKIAILDTGIDLSHKDLIKKVIASVNFTASSSGNDLFGHGTHVAGIAAGDTNNGIGAAGVGFNASIMNVKVIEDSGSGYNSSIAKGIIWAADNGAKVINMSLGGTTSSKTIEKAIYYAWKKGVVIVAAAGNDGSKTPNYPAACKNVISVAATDSNDNKANFSNFGPWVSVAAPGVDIFSTLPDHRNNVGSLNYGSLSGTSMAAPYVAGLVALVWSTSNGTDNATVRKKILTSAEKAGNIYALYHIKRINAYKAVATGVSKNKK